MQRLPRQPRSTNPADLRRAWSAERTAASHARAAGDTDGEWLRLGRANVLSQPLPVPHVRTHLAMLGRGIRRRDRSEIAGQLLRLLVAGPGSALGRYPLGNTGGADVAAMQPMPIPTDLQAILDGAAGMAS